MWLYLCIIQPISLSYKKHELNLREHQDSLPVFGGFCVAHLFIFLCCVVFLFCLSSCCVLCTQCCQFLWIVHSWMPPSVFSNVYLIASQSVSCYLFTSVCLFSRLLWHKLINDLIPSWMYRTKLTRFQIAYFSDLTTVYEFIQIFCIHWTKHLRNQTIY